MEIVQYNPRLKFMAFCFAAFDNANDAAQLCKLWVSFDEAIIAGCEARLTSIFIVLPVMKF